MYPEWGPAKNRPSDYPDDGGRSASQSLQASFDLRDDGGERPDDN